MSASTDLDEEAGENRVLVSTDGVAILAIVDWDASPGAIREARHELRAETDFLTASGAVGSDSQ